MGFIRQSLKNQITSLVKTTGQVLLKEFKKGKTNKFRFKSKHEIATAADFRAEKIILKKLQALTPDFRIISEETGDNKKESNYLWTVDPLDGTTNFYMANPLFAVQIALLYKNEPLLAWLYAPAINEFYIAEKGKGAFLNNKKINVSKRNLKQALLTYCHGNKISQIKKALKIYQYYKLKGFDIRQLGCAALEFGWLAKGKTECYISPSANLWDITPGVLLVKEAKGKAYDFQGNLWTTKSQTVFVSNGVIDKEILKFLKRL